MMYFKHKNGTINLTKVEAIINNGERYSETGTVFLGFSYKVVFKSGAVVSLIAEGLLKTWNNYLEGDD